MRGSLPTPVRYLYGKLSICKTDFLFSANPNNIGKIYVQNISQKKRILQSFTFIDRI